MKNVKGRPVKKYKCIQLKNTKEKHLMSLISLTNVLVQLRNNTVVSKTLLKHIFSSISLTSNLCIGKLL